ncbi:hypothetical protein AVEN_113203-1 [Araneus ventricosus]|uniref:BTB domain-containing protein n=1 Tax=Araneus ventricosus TaxID=182803 RepID=A0A4Y2M9B0_ARAVE|nr:hypothetical protein AVEN_113203-1 [Araneus ventricosus]
MSSTTTQSSGVTSVSYSFVLKWTLKAKQLKDLGNSSGASVIRSDLYQLKTTKNLRFYLEIEKPKKFNGDWATVKGSKMWSFKLAYAFSFSKDKAFKLKESPKLSFLDWFATNHVLDEENVTIHCVVVALPVHPAPSVKEDDLFLMKCQNSVDFEDMPNFTLPSGYTNEMVIEFIRQGELPDLTVGKAIEIIGQTKVHNCEVLKILCAEYLMNNITPQNFRQISRAAMDYALPLLERKCLKKITDGYNEIRY